MDINGFRVQDDVLRAASAQIQDAIGTEQTTMDAVTADGETYGNDALYQAFAGFCTRAHVVVDALRHNAQATGDELTRTADTYAETDYSAADLLGGGHPGDQSR